MKRFVGQVFNIFKKKKKKKNELCTKFAGRIGDSKFKWPLMQDVATINETQEIMILRPPIIAIKNDPINSFFSHNWF